MSDARPQGRSRRGARRLLAVLVIAGGVLVVPPPMAGAGQDAEPVATADAGLGAAIALLDDLDRKRITVGWDEQPLLRVINELDVIHGVPLSADWESLDRVGADRRTTVTLRAEDTPALAVLEQLALLVGDEFERATIESWGGRVLLTTDAIATRIVAPAVYDVRDLVAAEAGRRDPRGIGRLEVAPDVRGGGEAEEPAGDDPRAGADADADGGSDEGADAPPGQAAVDRAGPGERLLRMALEHAAPETWLQFGGASARVTERDGVLLVTASATTHRMLRTVLEALRQADPRGMSLEAAVIRIPAGVWARLDRRYDPSQAVFARRLMADPGAEVLWRSRSAVAMGARLRIAESVAAGDLGLTLAPSIMPEDRTVRLSVDLSWTGTDGGAAATLETAVPLATVGGAASIGIPGGVADGAELVLVVLPRRF